MNEKIIIKNKTCTKCNISKPLDEFHNDKNRKDGKFPQCKKCVNKNTGKYRKEHRKVLAGKSRKYYWNHREEISKQCKKRYENGGRQKAGYQSMYENKLCSSYLGVVIGERLCRHLFNDVEVMPNGNPGFDIICSKNKKIDVKTSSTRSKKGKNPCWGFEINLNKTADFFILVAFDNRTDLNPLHIWMIPGHEINYRTGKSISLSTIHKWDKWKRDIKEAQQCCREIKENEEVVRHVIRTNSCS
ncbi:hypothetical protein KAU33_09130 [Candidatus Dependentiae bacterium]|nr:hypothetical protein [Candidatus Dependentiae bacterium]